MVQVWNLREFQHELPLPVASVVFLFLHLSELEAEREPFHCISCLQSGGGDRLSVIPSFYTIITALFRERKIIYKVKVLDTGRSPNRPDSSLSHTGSTLVLALANRIG